MGDLNRFHVAQEYDYETALSEIKQGRKKSHWMWYIFPQIAGLGKSSVAQYYAIADLKEAEEYLRDPILSQRLIEISSALLECDSCDAAEIFQWPDDMKLKSSMTLFSIAAPNCPVFNKVLEKFFGGQRDELTINILNRLS
ncbi:MAG: DUF1810 domain-containing protein [Lachnospiraceae bacterium]|nr:DUF1810 domain-containing protein [Robinsoniella sp.]MDY3765713.1 DUF1810 domain-containing protein [Lachnospiraceae bacterium]